MKPRLPACLPLLVSLLFPSVPNAAENTAALAGSVGLPAEDASKQPGADAAWWDRARATIEAQEYEVSLGTSGLQAPNRANGLRTRFRGTGIEVEARRGDRAELPWRFEWRTLSFGRDGSRTAIDSTEARSEGTRVRYEHGALVEWYENRRDGLEQGFTLESRPRGRGTVRVEGAVSGGLHAEVAGDSSLAWFDENGVEVLRYSGLRSWDATGRPLPSRMELLTRSPGDAASDPVARACRVALVVNDRNAVYPITIDPLLTSPSWVAESNQAGCGFGYAVSTAGDVNGDGYSDVIVGAFAYDDGDLDEGRAFVYHGSAAGLSAAWSWTVAGEQSGALFGGAVSAAGDVNGDGYDDVIVGAQYYENGTQDEGGAFVYHGSAAGLSTSASWSAEGNQALSLFGAAVASAGDVNGDGYDDVIVGAYAYDNGQTDEGRAWVYHGSPAGLGTTASWTGEGNQVGAAYGRSVSTAGDVNGDGYADVIVGAYQYDNGQGDEGRVIVHLGSATGLAASPAWSAESNQVNALFGISVGNAGDVNGDGYADVIVGASWFDNGETDEGRAFVYQGSSSGLASSPAWTSEGNQAGALWGLSVATAGDVNGDGYADVIVGSWGYDQTQPNEGAAWLYVGSATGLLDAAQWSAAGQQAQAAFGYAVATAGDVNGDGYSDVLVGCPNHDNGQTDEGRASVYYGAPAGLATYFAWDDEGRQSNENFGYSVSSAGDVNGDGYSDVIVGAPDFTTNFNQEGRAYAYLGSANGLAQAPSWTVEGDQANGSLGFSVSTAGDVNGDGYSDVIVGEVFSEHGQLSEGRAYVYHGSPTGLASSPAWTAEGDQNAAHFGWSVSTAGDVNGDGYSDVIVSALDYFGGEAWEGRACVYHGSATGLASSPAWVTEGNQVGANFGWSVSTAGDVNGDGYSDVIVGARSHTDGEAQEGRASVYHGSATGLATSPAWVAEGNQVGASFGWSVSTAGDVNGDGYSDVIVGAPAFDDEEMQEGLACVFQGSATGLAAAPAWSVEGNQANALLGKAVSTAGDVNGDGYSDVLVGCPGFDHGLSDVGAAYFYTGSASGLSTVASWSAEGDQTFGFFATDVAGAGDVNGDGASDVAIGYPSFSGGTLPYQGRVNVYLGHDRGGVNRIARQARLAGPAPIAILGRSDSPDGFRLKALGRSAAGRGAVRFQFEVKPSGVPFDGTGLVTGPLVWTGAPAPGSGSSVALTGDATGLTPSTCYHWRARILADSPWFPHTPWLFAPDNAATETDLRTPGTAVAVEEGRAGPDSRALGVPSPNPFRTSTDIAYALGQGGAHRLAIYDVGGREVAVLSQGWLDAGAHRAHWDGRDARGGPSPDGMYFVRLELSDHVEQRKLVLTR